MKITQFAKVLSIGVAGLGVSQVICSAAAHNQQGQGLVGPLAPRICKTLQSVQPDVYSVLKAYSARK